MFLVSLSDIQGFLFVSDKQKALSIIIIAPQ